MLVLLIIHTALKKAEEMADAQLSDDEFDVSAASEQLGIDLSAVDLDDDDDDQIMSILGKRPVTAAASSSSSDPPKRAVLELNEDEQEIQEDIIVDASGNLKRMEEKKETDVVDDIFRWQVRLLMLCLSLYLDPRPSNNTRYIAYRLLVNSIKTKRQEMRTRQHLGTL